jgi:hypothetical protein
MSISGLPPSGGANRIASSYGFAPKRAPAEVAGHGSRVEVPAAHDPLPTTQSLSLRSVLNDEERAYFDQLSAMGPITYGPGSKGTGMVPEAPRGLRLDVRG